MLWAPSIPYDGRNVAGRTASTAGVDWRWSGARRARPFAFALVGGLASAGAALAAFGPNGTAGLTRSPPLRMIELALAGVAIVGLLMLPRSPADRGRAGRILRYAVAGTAALVALVFMGFANHWTDSGRLAGPLGVDLLEMLVAPLVVAALLTIARPVDRGLGIVRIVIDGAVIASSTVVVGWYVAVRSLHEDGSTFDVAPTTALAFLVIDAMAFSLGLLLLARSRPSTRRIVAVGVLGLALLLIADIARVIQVLPDDPGSGLLSELGWIASLACFAVSTWLPPSTGSGRARRSTVGSPWWLVMPYAFLLPVAVILLVAAFRDDVDALMTVSAAAIIAVLGVRHVLVRHRNEVLTGQLRRSVRQLDRRARHDELTGLLNRGGLVDALDALQPAEPVIADGLVAVVFVDVDRFKGINDALGHTVGDAVLRVIGTRIGSWVDDAGGIAARIAGDEFIVVLSGLESETAALRRAQDVLDLVEAPIPVGPRGELVVTASAGVAVTTDLGNDDAIIRHADLAMLEAKSGGRARVQLFEEELRQRCEDRMLVEQELRHALATDHEIEVHLQPLVELDGGGLWGAEALVRWRHPVHGTLYPSRFLEVAEESGLIVPLGERVLAVACGAAAALPGMVVAVNLSPRQLHDPGLAATVRGQLRRQDLAADRLCLEVTEEALVDARAITVLEDLRRVGVQVAIDDFGVGASSFRQLRRLPGALVKIDRSFIERIDRDSGDDDRVMVKAMVTLAEQLDLQVIAEGIERESQMRIVRDLGVTIGQGWYLGAPTRAAVFVTRRQGRVLLQRRDS